MLATVEPKLKNELCNQPSPWQGIEHQFVGPCPHRDMDCFIASKFCKFYLIRTDFTIGKSVYLVEVFRPFKLKGVFLCSECGHNKGIKRGSLAIFLKHERVIVSTSWF